MTTETRVLCSDDARPKFRLYWMLIRPFSDAIAGAPEEAFSRVFTRNARN